MDQTRPECGQLNDSSATNEQLQDTAPSENFFNSHLLKIDFPLVSQEYREDCKHYISTISEKVYPNGCVTIQTKVDHYLYTLEVSDEIGKPLLSDIVRFPQEVLSRSNNDDKENESGGSISPNDEPTCNNFANMKIKSNYKLVRERRKRKEEKARKAGTACDDSLSEDEDSESDEELGTTGYCICHEDSETSCCSNY